jgi:hypothetical protein
MNTDIQMHKLEFRSVFLLCCIVQLFQTRNVITTQNKVREKVIKILEYELKV